MDMRSLLERYSLNSRSAMYERLSVLGLKLADMSGESPDSLNRLDKLHEYLANGGKLKEYTEIAIAPLPIESPLSPAKTESLSIEEVSKLINAIANLINKPDPAAPYIFLEKAASNSWLLSTQKVYEVIGVKPKLKASNSEYIWGSFAFCKSGKIGRSTAWRVFKVSSSLESSEPQGSQGIYNFKG